MIFEFTIEGTNEKVYKFQTLVLYNSVRQAHKTGPFNDK
jgi:hypothetical protein